MLANSQQAYYNDNEVNIGWCLFRLTLIEKWY